MSSWTSYPKIFALGHAAVAAITDVPCRVEEKVDGSQFSFGLIDGTLRCKSHGKELILDAPEKMFASAVETAIGLYANRRLHPGWTYRGEVLNKPHHNALAYDRVPKGNIILFDVNTEEEAYLGGAALANEAELLGLESVPTLYIGRVTHDMFEEWLKITSILGGQLIEGVVLKPLDPIYSVHDGKALMGKFVSEKYKEVHRKSWGNENPKSGDILVRLAIALKTEARWNKAIIHGQEDGWIENSPKDIGRLIKEVQRDVGEEEGDYIVKTLLSWAMPHIRRAVIRGLPEWYKETLLARQFEDTTDVARGEDEGLALPQRTVMSAAHEGTKSRAEVRAAVQAVVNTPPPKEGEFNG